MRTSREMLMQKSPEIRLQQNITLNCLIDKLMLQQTVSQNSSKIQNSANI